MGSLVHWLSCNYMDGLIYFDLIVWWLEIHLQLRFACSAVGTKIKHIWQRVVVWWTDESQSTMVDPKEMLGKLISSRGHLTPNDRFFQTMLVILWLFQPHVMTSGHRSLHNMNHEFWIISPGIGVKIKTHLKPPPGLGYTQINGDESKPL